MSILDGFFEDVSTSEEPSFINFIYYFFLTNGVSLKEFNELPLPYIFSMLNVHKYVKDKEVEAMKKK